jgi:lincosamide nucleotidyltransferase A/C/D/E
MTADDVGSFVDLLHSQGVRVWLDGGWAVDACLGSQTRRHSDLDIVIEERDVPAVAAALQRLYGPPESNEHYPAEALTGKGAVVGRAVDCIKPEWLVRFHTGYPVAETDWADVSALCERFGIPVPDEYARFL